MSDSEKQQDRLESRLLRAWKILNERGENGAIVSEIAAEILGVDSPDSDQRRRFGMTMKAMHARGMAEVIEKRYAKSTARWRALPPQRWRHIETDALPSKKRAADPEQSEWYSRVVEEVSERRRFREMMVDRL